MLCPEQTKDKILTTRYFSAFDSEAFFVASGSPSMTVGGSIINNASTPTGTMFEYDASFSIETIALNDTSGSVDTFEDNQANGHRITDGGNLIDNGARVESESLHYVRQLDASGSPTGPVITITVFSQGGNTSDIWGFSSDAALVDGAQYVKIGGSNNGASDYAEFVPCFINGTQISTRKGFVAIENLKPGDLVLTRDNGFQPVRWLGVKHLTPQWLSQCPHLQPVKISAHAFGPGQPEQDLWVSPQHRLLIDSSLSALYFGESEVFAAAGLVTNQPGLSRPHVARLTYVHLLFDQHQVVLSNGLWTESFLPGKRLFSHGDVATQREITQLFPELGAGDHSQYQAARKILKQHETALLLP